MYLHNNDGSYSSGLAKFFLLISTEGIFVLLGSTNVKKKLYNNNKHT